MKNENDPRIRGLLAGRLPLVARVGSMSVALHGDVLVCAGSPLDVDAPPQGDILRWVESQIRQACAATGIACPGPVELVELDWSNRAPETMVEVFAVRLVVDEVAR